LFKCSTLIFSVSFKQGLTETCAGLTIQASDDLRFGIAGVPIPSVEVKMASCADVCDKAGMPYLSTDRHDVQGNPVWGRGEILVKGTNITLGYYMQPAATKEVYQDDGFFQTGDIGQFMEDGSIRIVDRKKNLVKLKGGEYVALEKMEMTYGNSKFVDAIAGGICCYGDGDMDRPVALMQLSEVSSMKWAKEHGMDGDFETIKKSMELYAAVIADLHGEFKKGELSHLEKLIAVAFLNTPWTPENGCLTAANKLQRRMVISMFEKEFEEVKKKGIFD
jgi:long-chain acyl-CoA synthetase